MVRFYSWPKLSAFGVVLNYVFALLAALAALDRAWLAFAVLGVIATLLEVGGIGDCAAALGSWLFGLKRLELEDENK